MSIVINLSSRLWIYHNLSFTLWSFHFLRIHITNVLSITKWKAQLETNRLGLLFQRESRKTFCEGQIMQSLFHLSNFHMVSGIDWQVKKVAIESVHWCRHHIMTVISGVAWRPVSFKQLYSLTSLDCLIEVLNDFIQWEAIWPCWHCPTVGQSLCKLPCPFIFSRWSNLCNQGFH